ncbi:hypothetical protein NHX12_032568 [Muraenolepis orangiensis]|uniref:Uncharacterized protein n=1 Tax=Muraenolepis orangiensis TaxID=630683 RepID=A0A9Q0IKS2_9TELE|nr:hypothetical protein NHX12_032568 [Muraenolepis orangiensis]
MQLCQQLADCEGGVLPASTPTSQVKCLIETGSTPPGPEGRPGCSFACIHRGSQKRYTTTTEEVAEESQLSQSCCPRLLVSQPIRGGSEAPRGSVLASDGTAGSTWQGLLTSRHTLEQRQKRLEGTQRYRSQLHATRNNRSKDTRTRSRNGPANSSMGETRDDGKGGRDVLRPFLSNRHTRI